MSRWIKRIIPQFILLLTKDVIGMFNALNGYVSDTALNEANLT